MYHTDHLRLLGDLRLILGISDGEGGLTRLEHLEVRLLEPGEEVCVRVDDPELQRLILSLLRQAGVKFQESNRRFDYGRRQGAEANSLRQIIH